MRRAADGIKELVELHARHGTAFDSSTVGVFWGSAKRLAPPKQLWHRSQREEFAPACQRTARVLPRLRPRELASTAHAMVSASSPLESALQSAPRSLSVL